MPLFLPICGTKRMIKLKSELPNPSRRHGARWLLSLVVAASLVGLVAERWRGRWALSSWKHDRAAQGEIFDAAQLWSPVTAESVEFSNAFSEASKKFPARLQAYAGQMSAIVPDESGTARRGSQQARPPFSPQNQTGNQTNTWRELDDLLQQAQPALQQLRELLKHPPTASHYEVAKLLDGDVIPSFVGHRRSAQTLHASALNNLHNHNLEGATRDLVALLALGKLGEQDPGLVNFMIRMAILGLSVDVCWDALQAEGWTELQLAGLQSHCLEITNVLSQLPRTLEAERIARIHALAWFRSHSYQAWVARYQELYAGFGMEPSFADVALSVRVRRQWLFHPLWSFAWADQEELKYLQDLQAEVTALRATLRNPSYLWLQEQLAANGQNYRAPAVAWRFYGRLPLVDRFAEVIGPSRVPESAYPYPDFSRAWFITLQNLTRHELVITAIALKRYELQHGKLPPDLAALMSDFLPALPRDLMDGQPLRYRLNGDGAFVVYSVGENLRDDGGDFSSASSKDNLPHPSPWSGRDWVWPQSTAGLKVPQVPSVARQSLSE